MSDNKFSDDTLTVEEAFWVLWYFLEGHYKLSGGQFDLSDILSASQPFEFDDKGMTRKAAYNTGFASGGLTCKLGALC